MAKDAELKEEKKKKRKSEAADLSVVDEKKAKKEKRKSLAAEGGDEKVSCALPAMLLSLSCSQEDEWRRMRPYGPILTPGRVRRPPRRHHPHRRSARRQEAVEEAVQDGQARVQGAPA